MVAHSKSAFIALIRQSIDRGTTKKELADALDCSIADAREYIRLNIPDLMARFDVLQENKATGRKAGHPWTSQAKAGYAAHQGRERAAPSKKPAAMPRTASHRYDPEWESVMREMRRIRAELELQPGERIFPALPRSVQAEIREQVRSFIAYSTGSVPVAGSKPLDKIIR